MKRVFAWAVLVSPLTAGVIAVVWVGGWLAVGCFAVAAVLVGASMWAMSILAE